VALDNNAYEIVDISIKTQANGLDYELMIADSTYHNIRFVKQACLTEAVAGYIGDADAFNQYQSYYHSSKGETSQELEMGRASFQILQLPEPVSQEGIYCKMFQSLKHVVWNKNIPSVGGVIIPLCTHNGAFRYMGYADVISDPINIDDFSEEPKAIEFGTAENGGYSVESWDDSSNEGNGRETGFYFLQGGFGVCFAIGKGGIRNAKIVKAKNPAYWVLETKKLFGHGIGSGYLSEDHCGEAGEEFLRSEQYEDALFCYELRKDAKTLSHRPAIFDRYMSGYATAIFNCGRQQDAIQLLQALVNGGNHLPNCQSMLSKMRSVYTL
jgi:hypothetical protein